MTSTIAFRGADHGAEWCPFPHYGFNAISLFAPLHVLTVSARHSCYFPPSKRSRIVSFNFPKPNGLRRARTRWPAGAAAHVALQRLVTRARPLPPDARRGPPQGNPARRPKGRGREFRRARAEHEHERRSIFAHVQKLQSLHTLEFRKRVARNHNMPHAPIECLDERFGSLDERMLNIETTAGQHRNDLSGPLFQVFENQRP